MTDEIEDDGFVTVYPDPGPDRGDGSPYDRGDADAYYGRGHRSRPHKIVNGQRVENLTRAEVAEYYRGFEDNPSGEKDWGDDG